ncbi:PREDICTED: 85/88 kDa calcium-independent phospholipase A2-like [Amphimedon queenslandica]|uniref:PNPLA domain-containing protein n=1 Tax=Amphimedon queenslandica TaxID=400682 RepID=A0A1X7U6Y9_AMPQE|nr:PREDICTED: 85/88 kDa calcium-independent phospholipase A2-like [Amphimedon queenslandica]|eukprot:XP_019855850.1 PREDICTED: 85/88 kDa calcium-independent phospholipase A2-like [Amphimedon queenslandica]
MHANREIYSLIEKVDSLQTKTRKYFTLNSSLPAERTRAGTYLMSLDGGGIRGFNTTTYLIALEDRMKELSPKCPPIQYYFDYIAGTSSGAIAALILLYTNYSLRIGRCLVYQILMKVFTLKSIKERKNSMETNLQSIFKKNVMSSLRGPPHAIVTTTKDPGKLCLMTSYDESEAGSNQQIWKAARMSSAAPFIFPSVDDIYLDGGLVANNPTNAALEEISQIEQNCEFGCILSIGTGSFENPKLKDNWDYFYWTFPFDQLRNPLELTKTIKTFIKNSYTKVRESSEESAKSLCETKGWEYHRWSPPLHKNLGSACTELNIIIDMMYHTEMYILQHPETIDGIAKCILAKKPAN